MTKRSKKQNEVVAVAMSTETTITTDTTDAELEALLSETTVETPAEIVEETVSDAVLESVVSDVAVEEIKTAAYAEQPAGAAIVETPAAAEATTTETPDEPKAKKERAPRMTFASKSEAVAHKAGGADALVLEVSDADLDETALAAKRDEFFAEVNKSAKKVGEKLLNAVHAATKPDVKLSTYTATALAVLTAKGTASSKDIFDAMIAKGRSVGTARSQSQQMMQLLPTLRIATREKSNLTLNPNSVLATALSAKL